MLNQCFYPDVVATAQYAADLASALALRGHEVTVVTSRRAYDGSDTAFANEEAWNGCKILRVPCFGFGKKSKFRRMVNFGSFFVSCAARLVRLKKFDIVLSLTTPPLISFVGALFVKLRGGKFLFWVMDLNPDEAVAAGWLREGSTAAKALNAVLTLSLHASQTIIVLDRFMRDRIAAKGVPAEKIRIIPPWSHGDVVFFDAEGRNAFRRKHNLQDKFVVMYSGNHTPCHPLDTVLQAALASRSDTKTQFCFVGGGSEFVKVEEFARKHALDNILCLPYQPLPVLSQSLSAADLHLVVMGEPFVGIVHASKIYNIMRIGTPVVYIGPPESHIGDIAALYADAPLLQVQHGQVQKLVDAIKNAAHYKLPNAAMRLAGCDYSQDTLVSSFADVIESSYTAEPLLGTTMPTVAAESLLHSHQYTAVE